MTYERPVSLDMVIPLDTRGLTVSLMVPSVFPLALKNGTAFKTMPP